MRTVAHIALATATLFVFALNPLGAGADDDGEDKLNFTTRLKGYQEVPAVSSTGKATFRARIADDKKSFAWKLEYEKLEGVVEQAHVHFGQKGVNGGISVFLCTNLGNGPAGTASCPQAGTVEGVATAAEVIGPAAQGIAAGEFEELLEAMRKGVAYANVHTDKHTGGEIRGQIKRDRDDD